MKYLIGRVVLVADAVLPRKIARRARRIVAAYAPRASASAAEGGGDILFGQLFAAATGRGSEYVPHNPAPLAQPSRIKAIAFYLPQYPPNPGERRVVGQGLHRVDERAPRRCRSSSAITSRACLTNSASTIYACRRCSAARSSLAKHYGLARLLFLLLLVFRPASVCLEAPLDQLARQSDLEFPVLPVLGQRELDAPLGRHRPRSPHGAEASRPKTISPFIEDLAPYLRDPRYIRVDGKPAALVYRVDILPRMCSAPSKAGAHYCRENGRGRIRIWSPRRPSAPATRATTASTRPWNSRRIS